MKIRTELILRSLITDFGRALVKMINGETVIIPKHRPEARFGVSVLLDVGSFS